LSRYHLDTDFLVYALSQRGPEWTRVQALADSDAVIEMSAIAWYEFTRGPRSAEQLAVARTFLGDEGVIPFDETLAERAAEVFRRLGSPRARAADIAIGVTAARVAATLLTRNARDFDGIEELTVEATV